MNKRRQTIKYLAADFLTATVAWFLLNLIRYSEVAQYEGFDSVGEYILSHQVVVGQVLIPLYWLILYYFSGYYNRLFGKLRIDEFFNTFVTVVIGATFIFFTVILNDLPESFGIYYTIYFSYGGIQFVLTYVCRSLTTGHAARKIARCEWAVNVLIIGVGGQAAKIRRELPRVGYRIIGFVKEDGRTDSEVVGTDEIVGCVDDLPLLMETMPVDELIIAPEKVHDGKNIRLLYSLYHYKRPIKIWAEKDNPFYMADVKTIHDIPLIEVTANNFSEAGKNIKYALDKIVSALVLILLSPLYACIAVGVKRSSKGPVFFKQERIGYMGRPFTIYKFRSMYADATGRGALLTEKNDPRVTPFGRFLRKYRLDEIPQFWNILKGDMSLVGPRPEQRYYIDQIVRKAPYYYLLHNVRPGITSWGMVKYGYADTIDKMIERLQYDMMYYKNMSLTLDITILIYTIKIVFTGKGV
ncbi:MAG: sugar transferase [Tannerella sp.]|jgi:exopolysaccharide biosynthesis polyprenyl glycosylphosphotransferase|nr:sugar transferase [Tannerella sp.]